MIAIIDYGAGNLHSVKKALDFLGAESIITNDENKILSADKVILPGVGAFGDAMAELRKSNMDKVVEKVAKSKKPLLGICLGLQLMFEESDEALNVEGLGILKGRCKRIPEKSGLKIPHIGWNSIEIVKNEGILKDLGKEPYVYFVHSYYIEPTFVEDIAAYTSYGEKLPIAFEKDNIFLTQFHPEKSGKTGLKILKNFIEL